MNREWVLHRRNAFGGIAALALFQSFGVFPSDVAIATDRESSGKLGEFDFLEGDWIIEHKRLKPNSANEWDEFAGTATCWSILNGLGSIEELRIPERNFSGMGIRLLDVENKVWNDFWVNSKKGVLSIPGLQGGFENGVGTFVAEEDIDGKKVLVKGVWDRITVNSCRWYQATSDDRGVTWNRNWIMRWQRQHPRSYLA